VAADRTGARGRPAIRGDHDGGEHFESEALLNELMKEAQNILTEQDPPAIYLGQHVDFTILGADIQGFAPNPLYLEAYNAYERPRAAS
jgi:hypothetical protein